MLTGRLPFDGESVAEVAVKHFTVIPESPTSLLPDIPPELEEITLRAMQPNPDDRYRTVDDMLADLGLKAEDVPLFAGEVEYADMGGGCASHNVQVNRLPEVIPTAHVVSAKNLPGNGTDPWHFSAQGYRILGQRYAKAALNLMGIDVEIDQPEMPVKYWAIDQRLASVSEIGAKHFAIVNEADGKAFYGVSGQLLGYDSFKKAFDVYNAGYLFRLGRITGGRSLRLITPDGDDYQMSGGVGYLNSQDVNGDCCFIQGLNNQRGYAIPDGAVWDVQYVEGKGWALKNVGTGKYLKDATSPAKYDEPTYFTFCTLAETTGYESTVSSPVSSHVADVYTLQGVKAGTKEQWNSLPSGVYVVDGKLRVKRL